MQNTLQGNTVKPKIISLQAVRGLAFIGIFCKHCNILNAGEWGVSVFFVLSGFLMVYSYHDKERTVSFKENLLFSIGKIKTLYPLHFFTMLVAIPLAVLESLGEINSVFFFKEGFKLILNIFLVQAWIPVLGAAFSLNGVAWYLSVSLFLYFMFPYILEYIKKYKTNKAPYIVMFSVFAIQVVFAYAMQFLNIPFAKEFIRWFTYVFPLYRLGDFIIGCNLGYLFVNSRKKISSAAATASEAIVLAFIALSIYIYANKITFLGGESFRYTVLFLPTSLAFVYLFAINKGIFSKMLANKWLISLGNISGYTFLFHQLIWRFMLLALSFANVTEDFIVWISKVVTFALTILFSILYMNAEKKAITRKRHALQ